MKVYDTPNKFIKLICPKGGTPYLQYYLFETRLSTRNLEYLGKKHNGSEDPDCRKHCFSSNNKLFFFSTEELSKVLLDFDEFKRNHSEQL